MSSYFFSLTPFLYIPANEKYAGININIITTANVIVEPDLDKMAEFIKAPTENNLYVITCFSDKEKLYSRVEVLTPTAK